MLLRRGANVRIKPCKLYDTSNDVPVPMADARDGRRGDCRKDRAAQVKGRPTDVLPSPQ